MSLELDPRFTFESFIVGTSNRLAAAAARRVADAPGSAYNPLFLYSASGLGKTHLIMAIGQHARTIHPDLRVVYDTMEHLVERVMSAIRAGDGDAFRSRLQGADLLLLDDIQFLAGRHGVQEELLRAWDGLSGRGGQVVLASDRPPTEIDDLDDRLLSRLSGGLIADLAAPDMETRAAIVRRKAGERGQELAEGVAEALARGAHANVRELQGALNRVLAVQELEGRSVAMAEACRLLGLPLEGRTGDEFGVFLTEITGTIGEVVQPGGAEARLAEAILRWEGEGFRTRLLEDALDDPPGAAEVEAFLAGFASRVERLRTVARSIRQTEPEAPELERTEVLRDPARLDEAEGLLKAVQARSRALPPPPPGPGLDALPLPPEHMALRAGRAVAEGTGDRYVPFYLHGADPALAEHVLAAVVREIAERQKGLAVAWLPGPAFSAELVDALADNSVEAWRTRLRRVGALAIPDVESLAGTERAQEELFHLFEDLRRAGARLLFSGAAPPRSIEGLVDRLRSRLESGLVVEVEAVSGDAHPAEAAQAAPSAAPSEAGRGEPRPAGAMVGGEGRLDRWFLSPEKALWRWPGHEDVPLEEGD